MARRSLGRLAEREVCTTERRFCTMGIIWRSSVARRSLGRPAEREVRTMEGRFCTMGII